MHSPRHPDSDPPPVTVEIARRERSGGESVAQLTLTAIDRHSPHAGAEPVILHTDRGDIGARYHPAEAATSSVSAGVVWVGGARGGLDGPAAGLYPAACARLQENGLAGLRLQYRRPNELNDCVLDALLGVAFLRLQGHERVALVGHSFGGAVVISAAAISLHVSAVVALSTQTYGAEAVAEIAPRPLLLVHGTDDEVLSSTCSEIVYAAAREPKELKLFAGARHGLDSMREDLLDLLTDWLLARA